jgi:hypothetical protein
MDSNSADKSATNPRRTFGGESHGVSGVLFHNSAQCWNRMLSTGVCSHMRRFSLYVFAGAIVGIAQSPEAGRIERFGSQATLIVDGPRPMDSAAITLAEQFGMNVSVEDPPYLFRDDVKDVTAEVARTPIPSRRVLVPRGGRLALEFSVRADGFPDDVRGLIKTLVDQANAQFPFAYRVDPMGSSYVIVPTRMRDALGNVIEITPLLDRHVNIPLGTRTIAETANLMAEALSAQTGLHVSCCQAFVAGIPWGRLPTTFEAHDESARSVLTRLIMADLQGKPNHYYWLQRCDPLPSNWCFINLKYASAPPSNPLHD